MLSCLTSLGISEFHRNSRASQPLLNLWELLPSSLSIELYFMVAGCAKNLTDHAQFKVHAEELARKGLCIPFAADSALAPWPLTQ